MTVDTANGLVFVALGNATDQNYGGSRPGTDLYATSLVALDAATGKLRWYYQTTHHDIYDWDVECSADADRSHEGWERRFRRWRNRPSWA